KHGSFRLTSGGGGKDDGVAAIQKHGARLLLNRSQARPAKPRHDSLLKPWCEAGERAHQTSSCGTSSSPSASGTMNGSPESTCCSSVLRGWGVKPYSCMGT